jgi:hypothetical protein
VLEPEPGKFNWAIVDLAIAEARAHQQKLAIRLMPYSNEDPLPEWYRKSGAKRANQDSDKDGKIWQPDFSDPLFLRNTGVDWFAEAGARYDGNSSGYRRYFFGGVIGRRLESVHAGLCSAKSVD